MLRNIIIKSGRTGVVAVITGASVIASLLIVTLIMEYMADGVDSTGIVIAILTPALIAPAMSWYIVGLLLEINDLEEAQRKLATYDMLTKVLTRRAFLVQCQSLMKLCKRNNQSMALAYIDLDNFKRVNDVYGHAAGDQVLRSFATGMAGRLRSSDLVGRIGGEEFAIAMPSTDSSNTMEVLEEIRLLTKNNTVIYFGKSIHYTISIGVALFDQANSPDLELLIRQADHALHDAKQAGKDCLVEYKARQTT